MKPTYFLVVTLLLGMVWSCQSDTAPATITEAATPKHHSDSTSTIDSINVVVSTKAIAVDSATAPIPAATPKVKTKKKQPNLPAPYTLSGVIPHRLDSLPDTAWVDLALLDSSIMMDIRYATTNNFMELQIYDCPACFTRAKTAKALLKIHQSLQQQGLGLKMFDCYRPSSAQYKLWKKMPDRRYVAPPEKGSVHSRGGAVDLTLVVLETGQELAMGTPYDYFGKEAYWSYTKHPENINNNRQLLRSTMEKYGFKITTTEWWHYSYRRAWYPLSNMQWPCQ